MAPAGLIATSSNVSLTPQGAGGRLAHQHWEQITSHLRRTLGERHAALFAEPNPDPARGAIDWYGPVGAEALPFDSLPDAARAAAEADLAVLVAEIRAQSERLVAARSESERVLGELIALALEVPDRAALRLAGGQPVLAPWGHVSAAPGAVRELLIRLVPTPVAPMQVVGPPPGAAPAARSAASTARASRAISHTPSPPSPAPSASDHRPARHHHGQRRRTRPSASRGAIARSSFVPGGGGPMSARSGPVFKGRRA